MGAALSCERRNAKATDPPSSDGDSAKIQNKSAPSISASAAAVAKAKEAKERGNTCFRNKAFQEALVAYSEALTLQPDDDAVLVSRAIVHRQLKEWVDAEKDARRATELAPGNIKAYYEMALALQQQKQLELALEACAAGLDVQSDYKALIQLQQVVKREKADALTAQAALKVAEACPASLITDEEKRGIIDASKFVWKGENPSPEERAFLFNGCLEMFLKKYKELSASVKECKKKASILETSMYSGEQKAGLAIKGGHSPMDRPDDVVLPADYGAKLGEINVEQLGAYHSENVDGRHLISVYGEIFDVSDRPDKYGPDSPYHDLTGKDISWGLFTGIDVGVMCNQFYDIYKAKDQGVDKIAGIISWRAWYEQEYGLPVGTLVEYKDEWKLPSPPLQEVDEACCIM